MPFGKDKNIAQGKPDGRKSGKHGKNINEVNKKTRFVKGDKRLVGDANPNKNKHNPAALGIGKETQFKKGHTPRNKLLRTMLKERGFSREVINDIFSQILTSNPDDITKMKLDGEISMLELIGISGVEAAMRTADFGRMDYLLGQIFGRQVQRTENVNYNMNIESQTSESDRDRINKILESKMK